MATVILCEAEGCINKENGECILSAIDVGFSTRCLSYDDGTEEDEEDEEVIN